MTPDPQSSDIPELPPDSIQQPLSDDPSPSRGLQMSSPNTNKDSGSGEDEQYQQIQRIYLDWHDGRRPLSGFVNALSAYTQRAELYGRLHENIEQFQGGHLTAAAYSERHAEITDRLAALTQQLKDMEEKNT
jgi:hypothetical protein